MTYLVIFAFFVFLSLVYEADVLEKKIIFQSSHALRIYIQPVKEHNSS